MEAIVFVGIQGSGKSTFYHQRFFHTHVRINLDMLKTRTRENILIHACIQARQRFVVDNTNPTREARQKYIAAANTAKFRLVACYFDSSPDEALLRNAERSGRARVPDKAIHATHRKLEPPAYSEGFDKIYSVRIDSAGEFQMELLPLDSDDEPGSVA
jgi:predicted kinase